jgi:hypothetical protein
MIRSSIARYLCATRALGLTAFLVSFGVAAPRAAEAQSAALDVFDCQSGSFEDQILCSILQAEINEELASRGLSLSQGGLLFNYDNPVATPINTGHSCSHTARIARSRVSALIGRDVELDFEGDMLDEPLVIALELPVRIDARIDMLERFGARILGSCKRVGSDSYFASGSLETQAKVAVAFELRPLRGMDSNGNIVVTLEPRVRVISALENTAVDFRLSGVSPLASIASVVLGVPGTVLRAVDAVFSGDSVRAVLQNAVIGDLALPVITTVGALPRPIEDMVLDLLARYAEVEAAKTVAHFGPDVEDDLNAEVREILHLDARGKRSFTVDKDFVSLLEEQGAEAPIFVAHPPPPSATPRPPVEPRPCPRCEIP